MDCFPKHPGNSAVETDTVILSGQFKQPQGGHIKGPKGTQQQAIRSTNIEANPLFSREPSISAQ